MTQLTAFCCALKTCYLLGRLAAAAALLILASATSMAAPPYVAPTQLAEFGSYPILGGLKLPTLTAAECLPIKYAPVAVFDRPGGRVAGQLVLGQKSSADESGCEARPDIWYRHPGTEVLARVLTLEVGYEEPGLAVVATQTHGGASWVKVVSHVGTHWLPVTKDAAYLSFEKDLVQGLSRIPETCSRTGHCNPVKPAVQKLAETAGQAREDTCYSNAYDVEAVVTLADGRTAYSVRLADSLRATYKGKLPLKALVPAYDKEGRWTGFFYSRGS